ncbi:MAG: DUF4062 domain-containing protein [Acidobacteriota bacterium]
MEKRYQVFVSSTYDDLRVERQEVMQALLELDCLPAGMELFPAADEDQWSLIKRIIEQSDYYIVIIGGRYGSKGPSGVSYTEMEFTYAKEIGKPVIGFLHGKPSDIPSGKTDPANAAELERFRGLVQQRLCKFWESPKELGSIVSRSIVQLMKAKPAVGWVRADQFTPDAAGEMINLRRRIDELEAQLAAAIAAQSPTAELAGGNDLHEIVGRAIVVLDRDTHTVKVSIPVPWNRILACVAKQAAEGCVLSRIKNALEFMIFDYFADDVFVQARAVLGDGGELKIPLRSAITIDDYALDRIMLHLRALSCVKEAAGKWTLTRQGDQMVVESLAFRRTPNA